MPDRIINPSIPNNLIVDYFQYNLTFPPEEYDIYLALLSDAPFEAFSETPTGMQTYLPGNANLEEAEACLNELAESRGLLWEKLHLPARNWNAVWESNFKPVYVGNFLAVRADFHPPLGDVRHELIINPKMSFGTGHHETTYMCLAAIEHLPIQGARLLDYGCGTGILGLLACKLGAAHVEAIDVDEEAYYNTAENSERNKIGNFTFRLGKLDVVEGRDFDGAFANLTRNVIFPTLPQLAPLLRPGAFLLLSGLLRSADEADTRQLIEENGFIFKSVTERNDWICMLVEKRP